MKITMILIVVLSFLSGAMVHAQLPPSPTTVTLSWEIPLLREDGSELLVEEIAGYELLDSCVTGLIEIMGGGTTEYSQAASVPFNCEYSISTVDTTGNRSVMSEPLTVKLNRPMPPVITGIAIN